MRYTVCGTERTVTGMECPYCKEAMEKGLIVANHPLYWTQKGHNTYYDTASIRLAEDAESFPGGPALTAWYCPTCNLLLARPPEQKERLTPKKAVEKGKDLVRKTAKKIRKIEP